MATVRRVILLSGPVSSGKSTLAKRLTERYGFTVVKSHDVLMTELGKDLGDRTRLQRAGTRLDKRTEGRWLSNAVARAMSEDERDMVDLVIDAVRIEQQAQGFRDAYGRRVLHVHVTASDETLKERHANRPSKFTEPATYESVAKDPTERRARKLHRIADLVVDTDLDDLEGEGALVRVAARLGLFGSSEPLVDVIVGGQFGSEGKGQVAAYLSPEYDILVRVGGPNAGHTVWRNPDPHVFHQLPSGSTSCNAHLVIGPGAVIAPAQLIAKASRYKIDHTRLSIDPQAMVIEDEDRRREGELVRSIGSTGQGVGAATARKVLMRGADKVRLAKNVNELKPFIRESLAIFEDAYAEGRRILLEGTQGTGLSLHHGMYPHVTSRDTTVAGCLAEAGIPPRRVARVIMVCRTYPIRVESPKGKGRTSGPLHREITLEEIHRRSTIPLDELRKTETTTTTKRLRRIGEFDWTLLRRAASLNSPTDLAITFVDYLGIENRRARRFEQLRADTILFLEEVERVAGARVSLISTRFHARPIIDRRTWGYARHA